MVDPGLSVNIKNCMGIAASHIDTVGEHTVFANFDHRIVFNHSKASTRRRESAYPLLLLQNLPLICPLKGLCHCAIEIIDEFKNAYFQVSLAGKIPPPK